jgi:hypothetical protein
MRATKEREKVLYVGIYEGRKLVRIEKIPDPRQVFCQQYNNLGGQLTAHPVSIATVVAKPSRFSE